MLIDWFTVGAQVVNFLVLVWLLNRFLYKPILRAIDEREKRIVAQIADAETMKDGAQKERDDLKQKNDEFNLHRASMLKEVADESESERHRLLDEARKESDAARARWQEALFDKQNVVAQDLAHRVQEEVLGIARKVLADLASSSLEERIAEVFVRRLRELSGDERKRLTSALTTSSRAVLLRTGFDLPQTQRETIQRAVADTLAVKTDVTFKTDPTLIGGIELSVDGYSVSWTIAGYLDSLSDMFEDLSHPGVRQENDEQTS